MKAYDEEEIVCLICQQWELKEVLSDASLPKSERQKLQQQLAKNIYQMAHLIDLYQNRFVIFHFRGKYYDLYSEVIKDAHFDLMQAEALLRQVFAKQKAIDVQVITVEELGKQMPDTFQAFVAYLPQEV
ncbi:MAG: hypothetical protein JWO58_924 [Chitinophagaceae bacterium]|nr:hypothetical protein [Chitinophagaceae bacterium]